MLTGLVKKLAAKTNLEDNSQWLPLWMHLRDTAEIMKRLLQNWVPISVRKTIGMEEEQAINTACFLGAVHDIGKATAVFQKNIFMHLPQVHERFTAVVDMPSTFAYPEHTPHARASEAILLELGCPGGLASIAGAHHGKPQQDHYEDYIDEQLEDYPENYWGKGQKAVWTEMWQALFESALHQANTAKKEELPILTIPQEVLLTGLLIMADWIASNTHYFPLISVDEVGDEAIYPARVDNAWRKISLTFPWESWYQSMDAPIFQERFGFFPNEVQQAVLSIANGTQHPGLFLIEAQMGIGKTEAALATAEVCAAKFGMGGLYFGLPTQATANGIFERLTLWASSQSEEMTHSIRLAHGMAELNESYQELLSGSAVVEEDDLENGVVVHRWFQGNKQALLADFVIGTVDQLLMAGLKQKHLMLRHLGLAGKVVVIDEVHAYDAYMNCYLDRVMEWLGKYGVPVILLSATLPEYRRKELLQSYLGGKKPADFSNCQGYPLITWTDGSQVLQKAVSLSAQQNTVELRYEKESALPNLLAAALEQGGCAGVIVNTVKKAQSVAKLLRAELVDCEVILFHAQFLMPDRVEKETILRKRLGKSSTAQQRNKLIVVGTQVLEQSLDIDFDFLVTELCPMDLLLQRIGREHRHQGRMRPPCLQNAVCTILLPEGEEFDAGSKAVYGEWLLWRTKELLPERIVLPNDIPGLVQRTYGWEEHDILMETEHSAQMKHAYRLQQAIKKQRADAYVIPKPPMHSSVSNPEVLDNWIKEEGARSDAAARAAVRDGDPCLEVLIMVQHKDGSVHFLPWQEDGESIPTDRPPSREESLKIARQRIRLPGYFSKRWNIDQVIRELEEQNRTQLSQWQLAPLLKGELVLLLDDTHSTCLAGCVLYYDQENGLIYEKGE